MTVDEHVQALRELIIRDQEDTIARWQAKADAADDESERAWYQRQADLERAIPFPWEGDAPVDPGLS